MTKIVYRSLKERSAGTSRPKSIVRSKAVTTPNGSRIRVATINAESPTFSQDLTAVFRRNVARARRENERLKDPTPHLDPDA